MKVRAYNKLYHQPIGKNFVVAWSMWIYRNSIAFGNFDAKPSYIINLAINLFKDMGYYNALFRIFGLDGSKGIQVRSKRCLYEVLLPKDG